MRPPGTVPCLLAEVFISPLFHVFKDRNKTFSQVSKVIFHTGRHFFIIMAGNEAVRFQFPKLLRQARFRNIADMPAKRSEAVYIPKGDVINDFNFPFAA